MLPGKCLPGGEYSELYESVYARWKEIWLRVFTEVGSPEAWNADTFFRCDVIPVIMYKGEIAAFLLSTVYSLQDSWIKDHSYFGIFSKAATARLRNRGIRNVMSYEYMTVLSDFRKSKLGFSLGGALAELGSYLRGDLECDAGVGVARLATKVDQIAHSVGAVTLEKEARRGNLLCEIIAVYKENDRPFPDKTVHELVVDIWNRRIYIDKFGNVRGDFRFSKAA